MHYVQYGCGLDGPEGWLNFDASPTLRMQRMPLIGLLASKPRFSRNVRFGDIIVGLPLPDGSATGVYCSHTLEHLAVADMRTALVNSRRLLKSGGIFRFVLPDLRALGEAYMAKPTAEASMEFVTKLRMGDEVRQRGLKAFIREWFGNSRHRWNWDFESMSHELRAAGFSNFRRAYLGDSSDAHFATAEDPERWNGELGFECVKN